MRFYHIALFLFIFQMAIFMVDGMGLFPIGVFDEATAETQAKLNAWVQEVNSTAQNYEYTTSGLGANLLNTIYSGVDFIQAFFIFLKILKNTILVSKDIFMMVGLTGPLADGLQLIIRLVYLVGIIQFLSNRSMKGQE